MIKIYKDKDGNRRTLADICATWASDALLASLGWTEVSQDYQPPQPPQPVPTKADKLAAIQAKYNPQLESLIAAKSAAEMMGNDTTAIKSQYSALMQAMIAEKKGVN